MGHAYRWVATDRARLVPGQTGSACSRRPWPPTCRGPYIHELNGACSPPFTGCGHDGQPQQPLVCTYPNDRRRMQAWRPVVATALICALLTLLGEPGPTFASSAECGALTADLNGDGAVDLQDFFILADQFGGKCERPTAGQTLRVELPGAIGMDFVWVTPGTFTMGGQLGLPPHPVRLSRGYYMATTEVTQAQWQAVMGTSPWAGKPYAQVGPNLPAVYISSYDVQALANTLNRAAGDSLYRLPTEAEWECACRAGTTSVWSFGDDEGPLGQYAWYSGNAAVYQPVATRLPNPWGLYDMHGNAWEWCSDFYTAYPSLGDTVVVDPNEPLGPTFERVTRGGMGPAQSTGSAYRLSYNASGRSWSCGARLVRVR